MLKSIAKLFGTKSEKDIKHLRPVLDKILREIDRLTPLSNDELRQQTDDLRVYLQEKLQDIDQELQQLHLQAQNLPSTHVLEKEEIFVQIDKKEEQRNEHIEKILIDILPKAFAIVKETTRRFKEHETIEVTATDYDKRLAAQVDYMTIQEDKARWKNQWTAAGNLITWDMEHYQVQLIGGIVLHQGKVAEMATGEGKTLVATLPVFLNALAGRGVHLVTVNNYLARRDSEWMGPIYQFHGFTVDCIDNYEPNSKERQQAYQADITYGTNNEFGFDYLRDNMARDTDELVQRGHHFVMVDEVDSVLIDEARTPLIISGPVPRGDEHEFHDLKPRIHKVVEAQKKQVNQYLNEAKKFINEGHEKEGGLALFRAYRAMPKYKPLIKILSETGNKSILQKTENYHLQDNKKEMPKADAPLFFTVDEKDNSVDLTEKGIDLITGEGGDTNFFILPEIGTELSKLEGNDQLSDKDRFVKKEEIIRDYADKSKRIHSINQLLKAYTLFERDIDYITVDGKVKIVDEQTGRVLDGRRYSDGLHQAIEAKENVKIENATQTYATITLQNYFRMYHKLSGMTGTAETEAAELWDIYKLDVVVIPTNKPTVRDDQEDLVFKTTREKFNAVIEQIVTLINQGRPVLVGTTSVEVSELMARMLQIKKIKHQVLNAKQHQREAEIVAEAGKPKTVTIATNMAGRGTDIKLTESSKAAGGLAIIGTERHESRRVDRQLRGRAGRQGDPGSSLFYVSLEDNLMRLFMPERIARLMDRLGLQEGEVISHSMVTKSIQRAQKKVEENNFGIRKRLLEYDNVMNAQREVIYKRRHNALFGERLQLDIFTMIYDTCEDLVTQAKSDEKVEDFKLHTVTVLGVEYMMTQAEFQKADQAELTENLYQKVRDHYETKNQLINEKVLPIVADIYHNQKTSMANVLVPVTDGYKQIGIDVNLQACVETKGETLIKAMEKNIVLAVIDQQWKEHLRDMDDLKQSVQNAVYEQKDPLLIYKFEGFEAFKRFIARVNTETVSFLMKGDIPVQEPREVKEARVRTRQQLKEQKEESQSLLQQNNSTDRQRADRPGIEKTMPIRAEKIANRNDRISVQYQDGRVLKDIKYKKVEEDITAGRCVLIK